MAAPTLTGTAVSASINAQTGSLGLTIPADCQAVVVKFGNWKGTANWLPAAPFTLNSVNVPTSTSYDDTTSIDHTWMGATISPPTGAQTLAWDFGVAPGTTGAVHVSYWTGVDTAVGVKQAVNAAAATVSGITQATADDVIIGVVAADSLPTVTNNAQTQILVSNTTVKVGSAYKVGPDDDWQGTGSVPSCCAIVLAGVTAGGGSTQPPRSMHQFRMRAA